MKTNLLFYPTIVSEKIPTSLFQKLSVSLHHGNLATDPRLASQNFTNALATIEPTLVKFQKKNEQLSKYISLFKVST